MRRPARFLLKRLLISPIIAAMVGWFVAPWFLHPMRRTLSPDLVHQADVAFTQLHAKREEFDVRASDGSLLRGWRVRAPEPNGNWVLLFHGVGDNRIGVLEHALVLLHAGYGVVMMDARAHGESEGAMATYGWLERNDTRAIVDALEVSEHPRHLFALGESMGAGLALQSAAVEPRIEGVVAEAAFANLREASYDYAGLRRSPLLGKTLFAPGTWMMLYHAEKLATLPAAEVSPEKAVASRTFPVLLICDGGDVALPCRHTKKIYDAAIGRKEMWIVPDAYHTAALGYQPVEFRRRVLAFFESQR
ncbi:MAG: alpha/beta fold hydrolase [Candidatus Acidiferrum sp.]|jgi:alpha-beta hydrolase superfamily lysophospholipase